MKDWIKVTLILCLFGTLRELRPSEPFVSEFLSGEWRNVTSEQLFRDVYPVGTYSYLGLLVVVFLVTDFLRFKPVIILSGVSGIAVYTILLWTTSLKWLQASQFFYGIYMATEVAYLTYIYAKVDSAKYQRVSSYTRIAALVGRFLAGVSGQLLVFFQLMDYRDLNYITFTAQILATFWAFWLPAVQFGIYFHRNTSANASVPIDKQQHTTAKPPLGSSFVEAATLIKNHARAAYTRPKVLAWSALYAAALALFVQAQIYMQLLWVEIQADTANAVAYNGAVEAAMTLLGACGAALASLGPKPGTPAAAAAVQGAALFLGTYLRILLLSYAAYIVTGTLFHYTITLASAKIAGQLSDESCFGLIFGINTLLGTGLQSLLTLTVQNLSLSMTAQYYLISGLYLLLASGWLIGWMVQLCKQKKSIHKDNQYSGAS